jgi:hypothetical protein
VAVSVRVSRLFAKPEHNQRSNEHFDGQPPLRADFYGH